MSSSLFDDEDAWDQAMTAWQKAEDESAAIFQTLRRLRQSAGTDPTSRKDKFLQMLDQLPISGTREDVLKQVEGWLQHQARDCLARAEEKRGSIGEVLRERDHLEHLWAIVQAERSGPGEDEKDHFGIGFEDLWVIVDDQGRVRLPQAFPYKRDTMFWVRKLESESEFGHEFRIQTLGAVLGLSGEEGSGDD